MKVLLLSDINSTHTKRWAIDLTQKGLKIALFSFVAPTDNWYEKYGIHVDYLGLKKKSIGGTKPLQLYKYIYLLPKVKKLIQNFKPDIIHAHFLTSYGVLASKLNFHPYIISVWGSDVFYDLENHSLLQNKMKNAIINADMVCSTSKIMTTPLLPYRKDIEVIPFGIDTNLFKPTSKRPEFPLIIGTVKGLKSIYGIEKLIRAFSQLNSSNEFNNIELHIYGDGHEKENYITLVNQLNLSKKIIFKGSIPNSEVPKALNSFSIFANLSEFESFGVSILEASSCALPVIASNVGGIPEVVENEKTGFLVEKDSVEEIVKAMKNLLSDKQLRVKMGENGRNFVMQHYDINKTTEKMINYYNLLIS